MLMLVGILASPIPLIFGTGITFVTLSFSGHSVELLNDGIEDGLIFLVHREGSLGLKTSAGADPELISLVRWAVFPSAFITTILLTILFDLL
jgi:hypothetical protein